MGRNPRKFCIFLQKFGKKNYIFYSNRLIIKIIILRKFSLIFGENDKIFSGFPPVYVYCEEWLSLCPKNDYDKKYLKLILSLTKWKSLHHLKHLPHLKKLSRIWNTAVLLRIQIPRFTTIVLNVSSNHCHCMLKNLKQNLLPPLIRFCDQIVMLLWPQIMNVKMSVYLTQSPRVMIPVLIPPAHPNWTTLPLRLRVWIIYYMTRIFKGGWMLIVSQILIQDAQPSEELGM